MEVCPNCGELTLNLDDVTGWCGDCTPASVVNNLRLYLTANADELEHYLLQGKSLNQAIDALHSKNGRPRCLVCGEPMRRAPRNAVFCKKNKECRRQSRRYTYFYREVGLTKSEALGKIMEELA